MCGNISESVTRVYEICISKALWDTWLHLKLKTSPDDVSRSINVGRGKSMVELKGYTEWTYLHDHVLSYKCWVFVYESTNVIWVPIIPYVLIKNVCFDDI